jgi:deoxycytidylate deaminase
MKGQEFDLLFVLLGTSGCAKKQIAAGTYVNGRFVWAVNHCVFAGEQCPRLNVPSGQGYELCTAHHAEQNLAELLKAKGQRSDGVLWVAGHYWACEPCARAMKEMGVTELRIKENK